MAIMGAWTNGYISVNGVDLSNHATSITVETTRDDVDVTAMGAVNKVHSPGLGDATITATFLQDYAAGSVDATLSAQTGSTTPFTVEVRPLNAARSTTNPGYSMSALMYGYTPVSGSVGDALTVDITFQNASQSGLSRLTS
jgi:hypothetical protein